LRDRGGYNERSASITARIPAERLDAVIVSVGGLCNVLSNSSSMDDITDRYFDAKAHLDSLSLQEERLLSILAKAEKLEEVITLEQSLSEVRYQIESLTAQLKRMDSQVSTSTLNMELREVVEYQQITDPPKSFGERVAAAWSRSVARVGDWFENLALFVVGDAPVLLLDLALLLLIVWIVWMLWRIIRRMTRRRGEAAPRVRRAKEPPVPPAPPAPPADAEK
ncbi:MAG: DUF4349 domain-containing protein, partial [Oscillospiraceae bacterium]